MTNNKKIVLLAPTPPPYGGIAIWTEKMKKAKLKNGWLVKVVDEKTIGKRSAFKFNLFNIHNEIKRHKRIWKNLRQELKSDEPTIVQACIPAGDRSMLREIISAKITKKRRKKFIVHFRCTIPNQVKTITSKLILKKLLKKTDFVFVLNEKSADFISKYTNNYAVIPNFIEKKQLYTRNNYSEKIKKVLYVGAIIESKGCKSIIDTARHFPEIEFRLVGKICMKLNDIPNNVVLLGENNREVIAKEYQGADVFMFLSLFPGEGFSNSLVEAMSYSLPCIVTDWAANKDMIEDKGGIVLKNNSVNEVITAINSISSAKIRRKMGKWNHEKVKSCYLDSCVINMYVNEYEKIIR